MQPPRPQDRPTLASARRVSWKVWIFQEWGLLLLAATLAVIIWKLSSESVLKERVIEGVRVELFVAPEDARRIGAVLDEEGATTTVTLFGSEREMFAVQEAMTAGRDGRPVLRLRVDPRIAPGNPKRRLTRNDRETWMWPVSNGAEIRLAARVPGGTVYRLERSIQGSIGVPPLTPATVEAAATKGIRVDLTLSKTTFELLAPEEIITGKAPGSGAALIVPDPLNLKDILDGEQVSLNKPLHFDLSFNGWLEARDMALDARPPISNYRRRLPLPKVKVTALLRQIGRLEKDDAGTTKNQLIIQLDDRYEAEIDEQQIPDVIKSTLLLFEGTLEGPLDVLDEIAKNKDEWTWQIWVREPENGWPVDADMSGQPSEWVDADAGIMWAPRRTAWADKGVRFVFKPGQDRFTIRVRHNPRKR